MLAGFHAMDEHFRTAPFERNLPVLLGLLGIWYAQLLRRADATRCCPTATTWRASRLPAAARHGVATASRSTSTAEPVDYQTGPVVWGTPGTNGQHAYYQLIHQGTTLIPADFIGFVADRPIRSAAHQDLLMANLFAQTEALAFGKTARRGRRRGRARRAGAAPHVRRQPPDATRSWPTSSRPPPSASSSRCTSTRCSSRARSGASTRSTSGASSWARCSPGRIVPELESREEPALRHDSSTNALIRRYRRRRAGA